ncbi:MAG: ArsR/SmtB family transcription factor, partial [Halobaculum sp.]
MTGRDQSEIDPVAAFACLGDETRLSILRALYDAVRDHEGPGQRAVPYSELQEAAGVADSGKFNYHLTQLRDQFVSKVEGGYVLDQTGKTVVKIVLRSFAVGDVSFDPVEIDAACPRCGGTLAVSYGDEHVTTRCLDCPGVADSPQFPDGTISTLVFPPAGVAERDPRELLSVVHRRYELQCAAMASGQCPTCGGVVDHEFGVCRGHDSDGICDDCG